MSKTEQDWLGMHSTGGGGAYGSRSRLNSNYYLWGEKKLPFALVTKHWFELWLCICTDKKYMVVGIEFGFNSALIASLCCIYMVPQSAYSWSKCFLLIPSISTLNQKCCLYSIKTTMIHIPNIKVTFRNMGILMR